MSAEKWESVTWDWIEREIVDYILIASKKPGNAQPFFNRLVKVDPPATLSVKPAATPRRSTSNG